MQSIVAKLSNRVDYIEKNSSSSGTGSSSGTSNIDESKVQSIVDKTLNSKITDEINDSNMLVTSKAVKEYCSSQNTIKDDLISTPIITGTSTSDLLTFNSSTHLLSFIPMKSFNITNMSVKRNGKLDDEINDWNIDETTISSIKTNIQTNNEPYELTSGSLIISFTLCSEQSSKENVQMNFGLIETYIPTTLDITFNGTLIEPNDTSHDINEVIGTLSNVKGDENSIPTINYVGNYVKEYVNENTGPHTHTSSSISDRISEYSPKAQLYEVKLQSDTVLSCYFESQTKIRVRMTSESTSDTYSFTFVYEGQEYEIDGGEIIINDHITCCLKTQWCGVVIDDIRKSIEFEMKDFMFNDVKLNDEKISIIYLPDVKIDKVMTQQAVKEYIKTNSISTYSNENKITYEITPDNISFEFEKQEDGSYKLVSNVQINRFNLKYKGKTYERDEFSGVYFFEDLIISYRNYIDIILPLSYNDEITLEFTNVKYIAPPYSPYSDAEYPDTTVHITVEKAMSDMNSDRLMTANAVQGYVQENIDNSHFLEQNIESHTYNFILCKLKKGQIYQGLLDFDYNAYEIYIAIIDVTRTATGYIKPIGSASPSSWTSLLIQAITFNNQNYVSLCITNSGTTLKMYLSTFCCSDKKIIKVLIDDEATQYQLPNGSSTLLQISS